MTYTIIFKFETTKNIFIRLVNNWLNIVDETTNTITFTTDEKEKLDQLLNTLKTQITFSLK